MKDGWEEIDFDTSPGGLRSLFVTVFPTWEAAAARPFGSTLQKHGVFVLRALLSHLHHLHLLYWGTPFHRVFGANGDQTADIWRTPKG